MATPPPAPQSFFNFSLLAPHIISRHPFHYSPAVREHWNVISSAVIHFPHFCAPFYGRDPRAPGSPRPGRPCVVFRVRGPPALANWMFRLAWLFIEWVIPTWTIQRGDGFVRHLVCSVLNGGSLSAHLPAGWRLVVFAISLCDVCPASFPTLLNLEDDGQSWGGLNAGRGDFLAIVEGGGGQGVGGGSRVGWAEARDGGLVWKKMGLAF